MVSLRIDSNSVATVRSSVNHIGNAVAGISFAGVESDGCGDSKVRLDVSYLAAYLDGRKLPDKQVHAGKMTGTPLTE